MIRKKQKAKVCVLVRLDPEFPPRFLRGGKRVSPPHVHLPTAPKHFSIVGKVSINLWLCLLKYGYRIEAKTDDFEVRIHAIFPKNKKCCRRCELLPKSRYEVRTE